MAEGLLSERAPGCCLSLLGVAPEGQGRGIGSALLAHWLVDVDAAAEPAWLETARAENLPFYRRFGFEVVGELEACGVPIWLMSRPGRAAGPTSSQRV